MATQLRHAHKQQMKCTPSLLPIKGFWSAIPSFPRKKMVLDRKTNFFVGKRWFWREKPTFFLGKTKKNHLLGDYAAKVQKAVFFWFSLGKRWFWTGKQTFSWEKDGFGQNLLFPRKKLVFRPKTIFFLGKPQKTIFLEFGRIVSQKMFFWFFWFSLAKVGL